MLIADFWSACHFEYYYNYPLVFPLPWGNETTRIVLYSNLHIPLKDRKTSLTVGL